MEEEQYITKKQVVKTISEYLEPLMQKNGFEFKKSTDSFVKKKDFGLLEISINSKNFWPLKQELNFPIAIVNHQINSIRMLFFKDVKKNDLIIYSWLVLPNSNELKYKKLYNSEDIEMAKKEAFELIEKEGFEFLEKYSNLQNIIEYASKIKNSHFISIVLVASKLAKNSHYEIVKNEVLNDLLHPDNRIENKQELQNLISYLDEL